MASDIIAVQADSLAGGAPEYGLTPYVGAVAYAGGMDYEEPLADAGFETPKICQAHKKNGLPCRAFVADNGVLCIGHLRQASAAAARES